MQSENNTRRVIWHSLEEGVESVEFLEVAMRQLLSVLRQEPLALNLAGNSLNEDDLPGVVTHLHNGNLNGCVESIRSLQTDPLNRRIGVIVTCHPTSPAARAARGRLSHAAWGLSIAGVLSLVYSPKNKYSLWHEALHLLGAQDHYDLTTFRRTCELPGCLMQYAPMDDVVGTGSIFCTATKEILRKSCSKINRAGNWGIENPFHARKDSRPH